ncbi:nucleoporin NUP35 [Thrips palmi]|uniref:Nucleoporin NUP53 n=1 Tax=Thrips palmi TaxID=161013 RepID=A0A6P8YIJ6_THRPL|nr:nucleoporin NUP35 [Thrips palmi]XP_034239624.1 nucleoporin NUP35 [Thrips palmi]
MEPMALGSPVGSPVSMGGMPQYLPQYLLGESDFNQSLNQSLTQSHPGPSNARQLAMSPTSPGSGRHVTFSPPSMGGLGPALSSADSRINRAPAASGLLGQSEKGSGPPTTGLFDTLRPSSEQSPFLSPTKPADGSMFQANLNASLLASSPPPPVTPGQHPQWTANEPLSSNWVTIFGFPTSATSSILAQFARYGNIVDKQLPVQGNWMHLQYQTRVEVRRALGNNGKIFGGNTMIGVMPCTDPSIVDISKENFNRDPNMSRMSAACNMSFGTPSMGLPQSSVASPFGTPHSVRPLQRAFSSAHVGDIVSPQHTPQRSTSFVSRAMDYVFNW